MDHQTNQQLVDALENQGGELSTLTSESESRLSSDQDRYLLWQVVQDFIGEGAAVCGPLFQPEPISTRRGQLERLLGGCHLVDAITNRAHQVGQLVKEAAKRIGSSQGQDMPREVAWAIIYQAENKEKLRGTLLCFLNEKYAAGS